MKENELSGLVASELDKLGLKVKRNVKVGSWEADFIVETPNEGTIVFEVKNRKIGIPDVLSVASVANNLSYPLSSFPGTITTSFEPNKLVREVAAENDVAIVVVRDREDFHWRTAFINLVAEVESIGKKLLGVAPSTKIPFSMIIEKFFTRIADKTLYMRFEFILKVRNKIMHGKDVSIVELKDAVGTADYILKELQKRT